jgi:peptidoglycan/LPS O-acetylase OafA/YrhL
MGVLRLFLALSVILGHSHGHGFFGLSFINAGIAVQTFFMISGFYMALVLNEKYNQPGDYWVFLSQRALRLYPTYFILMSLFIALGASVSAITGHPWGCMENWYKYGHLLTPLTAAYLVFENIVIFGQDLLMLLFMDPTHGTFSFAPGEGPSVLGADFLVIAAAWSLSVEFCFYLLAPFLVRRPARIQIILFILCFLIRAAYAYLIPSNAGSWTYFTFPPNLVFFVAGSIGYLIYKKYELPLGTLARTKPWILLPFIVLGLDYVRYPLNGQLYLLWFPLAFIVIPTLFALTKRNRWDRLIGELSYPCYLFHVQVLTITVPLLQDHRVLWARGPLSITVAILCSALYYHFIESRTERFRENLYRQSHPAAKA